MPKKNKAAKKAFEKTGEAPAEWLLDRLLVCDAIRMLPERDPWEMKGKIIRQPDSTEQKRRKLSELSLSVEHFVSDE
jgi:hypothetical protein